jgi:hypothetical protein
MNCPTRDLYYMSLSHHRVREVYRTLLSRFGRSPTARFLINSSVSNRIKTRFAWASSAFCSSSRSTALSWLHSAFGDVAVMEIYQEICWSILRGSTQRRSTSQFPRRKFRPVPYQSTLADQPKLAPGFPRPKSLEIQMEVRP